MKKIIMAFVACWLCLFISCDKEVAIQQQPKPKQEKLPDSFENNQVVTMRYSTGQEKLCSKSMFTLITYASTGESILNINSCYQVTF
jgi:hypothetical protein